MRIWFGDNTQLVLPVTRLEMHSRVSAFRNTTNKQTCSLVSFYMSPREKFKRNTFWGYPVRELRGISVLGFHALGHILRIMFVRDKPSSA